MKVKYTSGGSDAIDIAQLTLENVGVNRFRTSIPVKDEAGRIFSRTAEIEAASEKTKAGTVRVMLKCTIPYYPQYTNDDGVTAIDSTKSPKSYTLHIVHTVPAVMASEALEGALANQAAQVITLASNIIGMGLIVSTLNDNDTKMYKVPLQVGEPSVDGVNSYPLTAAHKDGGADSAVSVVYNVDKTALAGSLVGRALIGLMPIDINSDKTIPVSTQFLQGV